MSVEVKICGLNEPASLASALAGGARFVGFVFYPPSPRHLSIERAAELARSVPAGIVRVGVVVDPTDEFLARLLDKAPLDMLQLHGKETPERVQTIKDRFRVRAMKAIPVASEADPDAAKRYLGVADWLMFDAKPPKDKERRHAGRQRIGVRLAHPEGAALAAPMDAFRRARPRQSRGSRDRLGCHGSRCLVRRRVRAGRQGSGENPPVPRPREGALAACQFQRRMR